MSEYRETHIWRDLPHRNAAQELVIRFFVVYQNADRLKVNSVSAEIFRESDPSDLYSIPILKFEQDVYFKHSFKGDHKIRGWLRWRTGLQVTATQQIFGRIETGEIGSSDYWIYDGFMTEFGANSVRPTPVDPKPHPVVPEITPDRAATMFIADEHLEMTELFPFVYIRPWPKLAKSLAELGFMQVPTNVIKSDFYKKLSASKGQQILQEAVLFIEAAESQIATNSHRDKFFAALHQLPSPFSMFLHFPDEMRRDCTWQGLNRWVEDTFGTWEGLSSALAATEDRNTLVDIWNSAIALIITTGYDHAWLSKLIYILQVTHLVTTVIKRRQESVAEESEPFFSAQQLTRMAQAVLVLPDDIFPVFTPTDQVKPPAVQPYAVGSIQTVHYKPDRYILADVQRIEIVTEGETRQEVHRRLRQSEFDSAEQTIIDNKMLSSSDTTTADLVNQVQKTLSERLFTTKVNNYQTDYGLPSANTMTVKGDWSVDEQPAGGYLKDISKFARDVVERSVKVLCQDSLQRRRHRTYEEAETTETRTPTNLGSNGDRQTVYRWVSREYQMETKSSEDRLVFELFLDVPSKYLLHRVSKLCNIKIVAPIPPETLGVKSYKDLLPEARNTPSPSGSVYYLDIFNIYGIPPDENVPPPTRIVTTGLMSRNPIAETSLEIPSGYSALNATATVTSFSQTPQIQVVVGGVYLAPKADASQTFTGDFSATPAKYASELCAAVLCVATTNTSSSDADKSVTDATDSKDSIGDQNTKEFETFYAFNLQVQCVRKPTTLANWQMQTYQKIQAAYQQALAHYYAVLKDHQKSLQASPPQLLMDIVRDQVIQDALALFTKTTVATGPDATAETASRDFTPRYTQFLRNAFDWETMAIELLQDNDETICPDEGQSGLLSLFSAASYFLDFIQAKQVRLTLSVRPDYARTILLAYRTGYIWPCSDDTAPCMLSDINIVDLLLEQRNSPSEKAADKWTITLPTEMIALSRQDPFL